jgi:dolichol-phosphate mannosyltransferase
MRRFPSSTLLVVDDCSTDGTSNYLKNASQLNQRLNIVHRPKKLGLGTAHKLAMAWALIHGYGAILTSDADLSHRPTDMRAIYERSDKFNFCIGSRFRGGQNRSTRLRRLMTSLANRFLQVVLPGPISEYTTSLRFYDSIALQTLAEDLPQSNGYGFFIEVVEILREKKLTMGEVPIVFQDRLGGKSKIPRAQIFKSLSVTTVLLVARIAAAFGLERVSKRRLIFDSDCSECGNPYLESIQIRQKLQLVCLTCGHSRPYCDLVTH